jgi:putative transposase
MHRVRLYPTPNQVDRLEFTLRVTRQLYNALLDQRRYAWTSRRMSIATKAQYAELTALRREDPVVAAVYRELEDAVLHRLDLGFAAFFRRVKRGETPGYPRYKPASRWKQLEFPHGDRALRLDPEQRRVRVPGVGTVRLRKGRTVPAFGRAFIVEKNRRWYAVFECEREVAPLPATGRVVGVDRGVRVLAATSDGELIANPRVADRLRSRVEQHQQELERLSERDAGGRLLNRHDPGRLAAALRLARAKEREANARRDHLHKVALDLVRRYDRIAVERLELRSMTRSAKGTVEEPGSRVRQKAGLNRSLLDAGFGMLARLIREKAGYAAREVVDVAARYSSQTCAACGHVARESREGARFACVRCGHVADADVNAARVILLRAQSAPTSEPHAGDEPVRRARCVA